MLKLGPQQFKAHIVNFMVQHGMCKMKMKNAFKRAQCSFPSPLLTEMVPPPTHLGLDVD